MTHYAEAFYVEPGTCFRFRHNGVGHAAHCRKPVVARGQFIDGSGKRWRVDACEEHAEELSGVVVPRSNSNPV
ncbi:MAG: hypothetical protein WB565_17410 [Acidimicrobiales bacterium]